MRCFGIKTSIGAVWTIANVKNEVSAKIIRNFDKNYLVKPT